MAKPTKKKISGARARRKPGGGPTAAGGYNFQAAVAAISLAHLARGTPIGWLEGLTDDTPQEVACETQGPGDDLRVEFKSGEKVEIQVKKGLQAGSGQREAMYCLAEALHKGSIAYGILAVCPFSSRTIAQTLAADLVRLGEREDAEVDSLAADFRRRLIAANISVADICGRLRIVSVAALAANGSSVAAARAELAHLCAGPGDAFAAWNALYREASAMIARRGVHRIEGIAAVLATAGLDPASSRASETATGLARYRAAIVRHLQGELAEGSFFRRRKGAPVAEPRLKVLSNDQLVAGTLRKVVERLNEPIAWVVGGSGSGKTTLLQQVALAISDETEPPSSDQGCALPLIVNCARFGGDLAGLIASEARNATGIMIDLSGMQGVGFPFTLYCDDFQYCPDKRAMLEQIRALNRLHPRMRCVVLTQELAEGTLALLPGSVFRIAELDDKGLIDLFRGFMADEAAEILVDDLAGRGEIDAFRRPVLAALLAAAHTEALTGEGGSPASLRRGPLMRRVIRAGVLTHWLSNQSSDLVSPDTDAAVRDLSEIAADLVRAGAESLPATRLLSSGTGAASGWADIGLACGLLRRSGGEVGFTHAAIRDYFAAEWLVRAPPSRLLQAWFSTRWHGALKTFASLWDPDPRRLLWLRLAGHISLRVIASLRVMPAGYGTRLFYLLLEFAAESRVEERWLQMGVFEQYRKGHTFLEYPPKVTGMPYIGGWEDNLAHVYRLFGQLRQPEIDEWLRTTDHRRYAIHGVRQDHSEAGLEALLRGVGADNDGLADDISIQLAFEYPAAFIQRVMNRLLADPKVSMPRLLWRISRACSTRETASEDPDFRPPHRGRRISRILRTDSYWRDRMLELLLESADEATASSAGGVLRRLDPHSWLREDVEMILMVHLVEGVELVRRRAAGFLVYGRTDASRAALIHEVQAGSDIRVALHACGSLLYRDTGQAPRHFLTLLRRFGHLDPDLWRIHQSAIAQVVSAYVGEVGHKPYKKYLRAFLAYVRCGEGRFERLVASDGLSRLRGRTVAAAMRESAEAEADAVVRDKLLAKWAESQDVEVDEAVPYLLASPWPDVRARAARVVEFKNQRPRPEVVALLRETSARDGDERVRTAVTRVVAYIDTVWRHREMS